MMYFKFKDKDGNEKYGVCTDRVRSRIKELLHAEIFEEISKEEYDARDSKEEELK